MTVTFTLTAKGVVIGVFATLALVLGLYALWSLRKVKEQTHGDSAMAYGVPGLLAMFLCVIAAGIASLIGQYG